jgi:4-amino-4-deoxy-L-arabinose transferase-like glycosyltransferase
MDVTDKSITVRGNCRQTTRGQIIVLLVILCGSALLLLANLGNIYLWQDEAQTALISKTILTDGVPRGYDGKNFFSQELGAEYGKNYIWRWHTWLPFYVLAGFYKVFGASTFVSRLPFTLFGLATVAATYYFAKEYWPGSRIPLLAAGLLAISVPFLLLCRQCRYYSMTMCFTVLSMWAYVALLNGKRYAKVFLFIGSTLLFHSQHFYLPILFAAILLHAGIFRRDKLKLLLAVAAAVAIVNGPWVIWLSAAHYSATHTARALNSITPVVSIKTYIADIFSYMFPAWLLVIVVIAAVKRWLKQGQLVPVDARFWEKILLPVIFVIFNVFAMTAEAPLPYFRYIAPSLPLLIVLAAVVIDAALKMHFILGIAVIVLLMVSSQLKDYFYEITHDYDGPEEGIARYLNEHGLPDDIVVVTYGDMSLKFYTKMRIMGGFTGEDRKEAAKARWIIIRRHAIGEKDAAVVEYISQNIDTSAYLPILIDYPDILFENREDPKEHLFRTSTVPDKVVIFERMN